MKVDTITNIVYNMIKRKFWKKYYLTKRQVA
ncbi:hypothetical protein CHY_1551 [Carboxydothermus hydrogenoformans Z-2901]|uniref:Uncharacterized protein n=1 Tax=Carboxydothermus hydrogenoformans (strain ATCC BAA-161 / DSM 6008 / Z-2901) TaxID=246194 RepID=Q3ABV1_CARHZ|nr:hypothetical protein CHY_1551 [Carboxydothermus hydrogenoformans Z-2901]